MKKTAFGLLLLSFSLFSGFCSEVPDLLSGVWGNSDRYIVFDKNPSIVLRTFYRWYDDRAAESKEYTEKNPRQTNNTTQAASPEVLEYEFIPLTYELSEGIPLTIKNGDTLTAEKESSGAWNLIIKYPDRKEKYYVPIAVIGNNLYLNFLTKNDDSSEVPFSPLLNNQIVSPPNILTGFWQDGGNASGLMISPAISSKELVSLYITGNELFKIRYWKTDMDYHPDSKAGFEYNGESIVVPKHLFVAEQVYTCATGRSSKIRNMNKPELISSKAINNSILIGKKNGSTSYTVRCSTICTFSEPYMTKIPDKTLEQILKEDSEKKPPKPEPLFPPHGILDFDWSIIEDPPKNYSKRMLDMGK